MKIPPFDSLVWGSLRLTPIMDLLLDAYELRMHSDTHTIKLKAISGSTVGNSSTDDFAM